MWVAVVAIGDTFPSWVQMLPLKCRVQRRERASGERVRVARIIIVATCRNGAPDTETAALARSLVGESGNGGGNAICALASVAMSIPKNSSRGEGILARFVDSGAEGQGNWESLRARAEQASERHIGVVT